MTNYFTKYDSQSYIVKHYWKNDIIYHRHNHKQNTTTNTNTNTQHKHTQHTTQTHTNPRSLPPPLFYDWAGVMRLAGHAPAHGRVP